MFFAGSMRSFQGMPLRSPFVQRSCASTWHRMAIKPPSFAKTLPPRVYERDAFSFMSLSLIMTASSSVGERWYRFAEVETASEMRRHCDGVHAGVCHRIFSFTEQIVLVRQSFNGVVESSSELVVEAARAGGTGADGAVEALAPELE